MLRLILVVLLAGAPACGTNPDPTPTPPAPTPPPTPTPTGETCDMELNPALVAPLNNESDWKYAADQAPYKEQAVDAAILKAQASCPSMWSTFGTGGCLAAGIEGIDRGYKLISWHLQQAGVAASQAVDADRYYDHLYVLDGGKRWESWKLFAYVPDHPGCLTQNAFKGGYDYIGKATPPPATPPPATPPPTPPPTSPPSTTGCSAPITPKVDRWNPLHLINGWYDATPLFYNRETQRWDGTPVNGYCDATGWQGARLHCPARKECGEVPDPTAVKCEERVACERLGVGGNASTGKPLWQCGTGDVANGEVELHENIFKARCVTGKWIRVCSADGAVCSDKKEL